MISVEEALSLILADVEPTLAEEVSIEDALGRILAEDVRALLTQPPFNASAMDGYAVRFEDAVEGATLEVVGEAAAGAPVDAVVGKGEAIRIFTGGVVPEGADHVIIQEDVVRDGDRIRIVAPQLVAANVRQAGKDFSKGDVIATAGRGLSAVDLSLIAAANIGRIRVRRRPVVALFDNGDELVEPGNTLNAGQIIGSNRFALAALIREWGGEPHYLGRAADNFASVRAKFEATRNADILVAIGGASVGDHDYVRPAFHDVGGRLVFSKVAVKPGKPTWFGDIQATRVLGLPGNPASAIVCAILFLRPLIQRLCGVTAGAVRKALAAVSIPENGSRETYLRAHIVDKSAGANRFAPFEDQDSSLLAPLAGAEALIRRLANAPAVSADEEIEILPLR